MRRSATSLLGLAAVAAVISCADGGLAPSEARTPAILDAPQVSYDALAAGTTYTFSVTIDPSRDNVYSDGITSIRIPAGSICDLRSSYGPDAWDLPCAPQAAAFTLPITIEGLSGGRLILHLGRDLRFSPTADASRHVVMTVNAPAVQSSSANLRSHAIFWLPSGQTKLVDEGKVDNSLTTVIDRVNGKLTRRVKHFSGYVIKIGGTSYTCESESASTLDQCVPNGEVITSNQ